MLRNLSVSNEVRYLIAHHGVGKQKYAIANIPDMFVVLLRISHIVFARSWSDAAQRKLQLISYLGANVIQPKGGMGRKCGETSQASPSYKLIAALNRSPLTALPPRPFFWLENCLASVFGPWFCSGLMQTTHCGNWLSSSLNDPHMSWQPCKHWMRLMTGLSSVLLLEARTHTNRRAKIWSWGQLEIWFSDLVFYETRL